MNAKDVMLFTKPIDRGLGFALFALPASIIFTSQYKTLISIGDMSGIDKNISFKL